MAIPCAMCGKELEEGCIYCADCDYVNDSKGGYKGSQEEE